MDGDIAMDNTRILQDHMDRILQDGCYHLVLNFEEVPFVSSRGIGILASTYTLVNLNEGTLCVAAANPDIEKILRRIKFDTLLHLAADEESGIRTVWRSKTLKELELVLDQHEGLTLLRFTRPVPSLDQARFHELVAGLLQDCGPVVLDVADGELLSPAFTQHLKDLADGVPGMNGRIPILCSVAERRKWLREQGPPFLFEPFLDAEQARTFLEGPGATASADLKTQVQRLRDESPTKRRIAARVIGALGEQEGVKPLIEALRDDNDAVAEHALRSLEALTRQDFGKNYEAWLRWHGMSRPL